MSNIAEGYESDANRELARLLLFSKGSAGEVRSLLYLAKDLNYLAEKEFSKHYETALSVIKQISNFIKYLKQRAKQ